VASLYPRVVHLGDTDAAGVMYFARLFDMCHEAYEAALVEAGVDLGELVRASQIALPIARAEADYLQPLVCGQQLTVAVSPQAIDETEFTLKYEVATVASGVAARVSTRHVCLHPRQQRRLSLPEGIARWLFRAAAESTL